MKPVNEFMGQSSAPAHCETVTFEDPEDQALYERAQKKFILLAERKNLTSADFDEFESCKGALREAIQDAYAQAAGLSSWA